MERPAAHQPDPVADVFALLSLLHRHDVTPLHGRWLPPTYARRLGRRLALPLPQPLRSERHVPRLAFVHYLSEQAGLIAVIGGYLKPTLAAHEWLATARSAQIDHLWRAWRDTTPSNRDLYRRYRLPGWQRDDPLADLDRLLTHLAPCPPGQWVALDAFLDAVEAADPGLFRPTDHYLTLAALSDDDRAQTRRQTRHTLAALLTGPLHWLGLLSLSPLPQRGGETTFSLTPTAARLLGQSTASEQPPSSDPQPWRIADDLTVTIPPDAPLPDRLILETWAEEPDEPSAPWRLTPASLIRALERGHPLAELTTLLERATGDALPVLIAETLLHWADAYGQVAIRPVTILQTADRALLEELAAHRRLRQHFRETLSPRAVVVDPAQVGALVRLLHRHGHHPRVELPPDNPAHSELAPEGVAYLLVAARVYAHLAEHIVLPLSIPHTLLDDLEAQLNPRQRQAVRVAVQTTLDRRQRVADGWQPHSAYTVAYPVADTLALIQRAIESQRPLDIEYYTEGRGELTRRTVEPLRLERRHDAPYLVAFCRLRRDERLFRVDRIKAVHLAGEV